MITDYIFYRLYTMYKRHGDPPFLSTCIFFSYIIGIATIIIFFSIKKWANFHNIRIIFLEGIASLFFMITPLLLILLFCVIVYRNKRIESFSKKYKGCIKNKIIADWMIWCIPIYEIILGVIIYYFFIE